MVCQAIPQLVAGVNAHAGTHLELPLTRHDLGVEATYQGHTLLPLCNST